MRAKTRAGWAAATCALWLLSAGALAQGPQRMEPGRDANGNTARRMMAADRPDQLAPDAAEPPRRGNRLSPEERRQLRRDVHQAGRDLYPERIPPGRRGEMRRQ